MEERAMQLQMEAHRSFPQGLPLSCPCPPGRLERAYERCGEITGEYAKTFYLGTQLMTPDKARAIWAIYVWCRRTDELVDGPNAARITPAAIGARLRERGGAGRERGRSAMMPTAMSSWRGPHAPTVAVFRRPVGTEAGGHLRGPPVRRTRRRPHGHPHALPPGHPALPVRAGAGWAAARQLPLPVPGRGPDRRSRPACRSDMIEGMRMDLRKARYQTYDELYEYCYRVAGTVGLMSMPVMGLDPAWKGDMEPVYRAALALGTANQLTNILRDVGEDASQRNRIYLPLDELDEFGISEKDVLRRVSPGDGWAGSPGGGGGRWRDGEEVQHAAWATRGAVSLLAGACSARPRGRSTTGGSASWPSRSSARASASTRPRRGQTRRGAAGEQSVIEAGSSTLPDSL